MMAIKSFVRSLAITALLASWFAHGTLLSPGDIVVSDSFSFSGRRTTLCG